MSTVIKLVSSDAHLAQSLRETGMQCVAVSSDALATLAQPGARQPEVLVVDLRGKQQLPPALSSLKRQHPATGVLLVVSQLEPTLMLEAMRAGVNECVTDPVSVPDLLAAVKRLMGNLAAGARGEVYAFVGAKGGVGATTVAVNVATALAKHSDSTLLIDLNVAFGDAAVFLGEEPRFSVMDALEHVQRLDEAFFSGLVVRTQVGPRAARGAGAAHHRHLRRHPHPGADRFRQPDAPDYGARRAAVRHRRARLAGDGDPDHPGRQPGAGHRAQRQPHGRRRCASAMARTGSTWSSREPTVEPKSGTRTFSAPWGSTVRHTFPSDYRLALQAMNKGRPIVLDANSELAAAFSAFARDLAGVAEAEGGERKAWTGGLFGRLAPKRA